jgi:hypothetical protein
MMRAVVIRACFLGVGFGVLLIASSCGGGGGGGSTPPPSQSVSITMSPTTATVGFGAQQQFTATVSGTTNTAVTWSLSAQVGSISSSGLYTAPTPNPLPPPLASVHPLLVGGGQTVPSVNVSLTPLIGSNSVTVTATSQADTTKSASATLTVAALSLIAVGTCGTTQCQAGSTGVQLTQGQQVTLFIVGNGVVQGVTFVFSGPPDITITSTAFTQTNDGLPAAEVGITVGPTAQLGPRSIMVTNSNGELASFTGGLLVAP